MRRLTLVRLSIGLVISLPASVSADAQPNPHLACMREHVRIVLQWARDYFKTFPAEVPLRTVPNEGAAIVLPHGHRVQVYRDEVPTGDARERQTFAESTYLSSDRGLFPLSRARTLLSSNRFQEGVVSDFYPAGTLDLNRWQGKVVIDAATGNGRFVKEARKERDRLGLKFTLVGIDLSISERDQRSGYLFQGDLARSPLETGIADEILNTFGPLSYDIGRNRALPVRILKDQHRVLKDGGLIHISPLSQAQIVILKEILTEIPGLELLTSDGDGSIPYKDERGRDFSVTLRKSSTPADPH